MFSDQSGSQALNVSGREEEMEVFGWVGGDWGDVVSFLDSAQWKGMSVFCQRKRGRKAAGGGRGWLWVVFSCWPGKPGGSSCPNQCRLPTFSVTPSPPKNSILQLVSAKGGGR